jgi:hypothetical protein
MPGLGRSRRGRTRGASRPVGVPERRRRCGREAMSARWGGARTVALATSVVVGLGLAWRSIRYAAAFPLWGDEAFLAVNLLTRDVAGLARRLEFGQVAPPGFLWAEWGVARRLGPSEWALRLVPWLAGMATLVIFRGFCRRAATRRATLLAVAILASSFYPVRHAAEVKPYAIDLLASLLLTTLGWAVWRDPYNLGRWAALVGAGVIGVWCSYPAVFPATSVAMLLGVLALRRRSRRLAACGLAFAMLTGASWAAMMATFAGPQLREASWLVELTTWRDAFPPLADPRRLPGWLLKVHAGYMLAYPYGGRDCGSVATLLLVVLGVREMARRRPRRPLLWLLLGPLPVAMVAAALHRYPYGTSVRVMLYMAPAFCLLAAEGAVGLLRARGARRRGVLVLAALLGLIPIGGACCDVAMPYKEPVDLAARRLVRRLAERAAPGDRWIVFNGATPPPPIPDLMLSRWVARVAKFRFYLLSLAPVPVRWEPDPRSVAPAPRGRTWLIVHDHGFATLYPRMRQDIYQSLIFERLGPPRSTSYPLEEGSSVAVHVFDHRR